MADSADSFFDGITNRHRLSIVALVSLAGLASAGANAAGFIVPGVVAVFAMFLLRYSARDLSKREYYKLPGSRFDNGDDRCMYCGHRGRHGRGIYTHGEYKEDTKYHECSK